MKEFIISKNDADQRLDKFLTKAAPNLPKSMLYKAIRTKNIKINGKRAEISTKLAEKDVVRAYLPDEVFKKSPVTHDFMRAGKDLDILYEDDNIILLNKAVGVLCHPDGKEYIDTLIARVKRYLYDKGEYLPDQENAFTPALANRIDRNTAGIVIAAKNAEALRILNQKIKNRELHKQYLCVAHGVFKKQSDILKGYLTKDERKNQVKIFDSPIPGGKLIETKYKVLDTIHDLSLVEIELLTGRTHQIRAHMASIGHPLLGDTKYLTSVYKKQDSYNKQFLCAYKLTFDFKTDAGCLNTLNGRAFTLDHVWFTEPFYQGKL